MIIAIKTYENYLNIPSDVCTAIVEKGQKYISDLMIYPKGSSHIYKLFNKKTITPTGITKWTNKTNVTLNCMKVMSKLKATTNDRKLIFFYTGPNL